MAAFIEPTCPTSFPVEQSECTQPGPSSRPPLQQRTWDATSNSSSDLDVHGPPLIFSTSFDAMDIGAQIPQAQLLDPSPFVDPFPGGSWATGGIREPLGNGDFQLDIDPSIFQLAGPSPEFLDVTSAMVYGDCASQDPCDLVFLSYADAEQCFPVIRDLFNGDYMEEDEGCPFQDVSNEDTVQESTSAWVRENEDILRLMQESDHSDYLLPISVGPDFDIQSEEAEGQHSTWMEQNADILRLIDASDPEHGWECVDYGYSEKFNAPLVLDEQDAVSNSSPPAACFSLDLDAPPDQDTVTPGTLTTMELEELFGETPDDEILDDAGSQTRPEHRRLPHEVTPARQLSHDSGLQNQISPVASQDSPLDSTSSIAARSLPSSPTYLQHGTTGTSKSESSSRQHREQRKFNPVVPAHTSTRVHRLDSCRAPSGFDIDAELARVEPLRARAVCKWGAHCDTEIGVDPASVATHLKDAHKVHIECKVGPRPAGLPFSCMWPDCEETAVGRGMRGHTVVQHVRCAHLGATVVACPFCPAGMPPFPSMKLLKEHLRRVAQRRLPTSAAKSGCNDV
ncbi:hypothetical protein C8R44DRAFT_985475 [Mycena epipterygia]|nr:hypothetical protein C8R44DRAFT_985475 [Mycena epipterygia]